MVPNHHDSVIVTLVCGEYLPSGHVCHCSLALKIGVHEVAHEESASEQQCPLGPCGQSSVSLRKSRQTAGTFLADNSLPGPSSMNLFLLGP